MYKCLDYRFDTSLQIIEICTHFELLVDFKQSLWLADKLRQSFDSPLRAIHAFKAGKFSREEILNSEKLIEVGYSSVGKSQRAEN